MGYNSAHYTWAIGEKNNSIHESHEEQNEHLFWKGTLGRQAPLSLHNHLSSLSLNFLLYKIGHSYFRNQLQGLHEVMYI